MKKFRLTSLLLIVSIMLMLVVGCSVEKPEPVSEKTRVGLIVGLGGLGDKSFNDQALEGLKRAEKDFDLDIKVLEPKDPAEIEDMQRTLVAMGYEFIILNGFDHIEALQKVADEAPEVSFAIIDAVVDKPNVLSVTYATHEGSFLAGAIAAMKNKTNSIGFIGGMDIPLIQKFGVGYEEGAKHIKPNIEVKTKFIGSDPSAFGNPSLGKIMALDMAKQKVDVVYHAAGGSGAGVIAGAKEAGIAAIGCNFNQDSLAPDTVITSMLTKGEVAVYEAVKKFVSGQKTSGILEMNLKNDGVGVVLDDALSEEEKQKVEELKQNIIDGKIKVTDILKEEQ